MAEPEEGAITCKVVLIGESGVGKSCLTNKATNNTKNSRNFLH